MQIWNWLWDKSNDTIEGWNLITGFPAHTIPRNYCGVSSSAFSGGFEPAELPGRKERPIFCPLSWKTKFCASLLVFHHCATAESRRSLANVDVVATVSHSLLYHALWEKKDKQILAMAFSRCSSSHTRVLRGIHSSPFHSNILLRSPSAHSNSVLTFFTVFGLFLVISEFGSPDYISDFQNLSVFSRLFACDHIVCHSYT